MNPPTEFATERLLIRRPLPGDGPALNAAVLESFDVQHQWVPWAQTRPTVAEPEANSRETHEAFVARDGFRVLYHALLAEEGGEDVIHVAAVKEGECGHGAVGVAEPGRQVIARAATTA